AVHPLTLHLNSHFVAGKCTQLSAAHLGNPPVIADIDPQTILMILVHMLQNRLHFLFSQCHNYSLPVMMIMTADPRALTLLLLDRSYRRGNSQKMTDNTRLTRIMVVMGMNILKPGRSMTISPGNRPSGSLPSQGQSSPRATIMMPMIIRVFCIGSSVSLASND